MQNERKQSLRETLAVLASSHAIVVEHIELVIRLLRDELRESESDSQLRSTLFPEPRDNPYVNRQTLCVHWQGNICYLGNTLLFHFFERISRSPNQYVPYRVLLDEVWGGPRDTSSIRGVAKRLRDRLTQHGMTELSNSIDGSNSGYYGLILV